MPPRARRRRPSPGTPVRITPLVQRGVVTLLPNSRYRVEKPKYDAPKWSRDNRGRLVSRVPRRPNVGGFGDLEAFYHVLRKNPSEVLPPQQTLWRQRYGDNHSIAYRPLWPGIAQNLVEPLRTRQDIDSDDEGDYEGAVGVPYLFAYDENGPPDEDGLFYRRWRPFEIIANGGYGVVITYVDNALNLPDDLDDVADEHKKVAKFNYRGGDLKEIMQSVVAQASISDMVRHAGRAQRRAGRAQRRAGQAQRRAAAAQQQAAWADVGVEEYSHFQPPSKTPVVEVDTADTFRQETMILEILEMTGSPHLPKIWKLADPPQDGTLCTMEYIPGARTLDEQLDTQSNWKVPIRLVWEAVFCLSKALSVMAYGSEDPAPSHRVHGWNQIVHLDWGAQNIFVQRDHPSHTCSHGPCFMVGDFGFALVVPNRAAAKAKFRLAQLQRGWHIGLNPQLPEGNIDTKRPLQELEKDPIIGHFSYKTNVFLMADRVWHENLGGDQVGRNGIMRYLQDGLTPAEHVQLGLDLESQVPDDERLGEPLDEMDEEREGEDGNDDAGDYAPRLRGYVDVAKSLIDQPVVQSTRVSEQRFASLMTRCRDRDPSQRPEIEEIMLHAARGMAEAGVYVPPTPSSGSGSGSSSGDNEDDGS